LKTLKGGEKLSDLDVMMILNVNLREIGCDGGQLDSAGWGYCEMARFCDHSNEHLGSQIAGVFWPAN